MSIDIHAEPLTIWLIGHGAKPQAYCVADRRPDGGEPSFTGMTLVERAALRALCEEAIAAIDRSDGSTEREVP